MGNMLKGKVAIVTGAGTVAGLKDMDPVGNGMAAAMLYAAEGADVLAVDINKKAAEQTQARIEHEGGSCRIFEADVSKAVDCRDMAESCIHHYGRIDILHNNVGIMQPIPGGIIEVEEAVWDKVMNVNLKSVFLASRAVIPQMIVQKSGCIINISSIAATRYRMSRTFTYPVSKAAQNALTRCMAVELADKGIRVNGIMPGMMDTPTIYQSKLSKTSEGDLDAMRKRRNEAVPMKKMGTSWDVARAALFLVSDQAGYITGHILSVDGGMGALST